MKKFAAAAMVIALLGLCGCGKSGPESIPPITTTFEVETIPWTDTIPLSEIDPIFGPGPFSIDDLTERFGELVWGLSLEHENGWIYTRVNYAGFYFTLILDTDQPFDEIDPEQIDRMQPMDVYMTTVGIEGFPLPRGIRLNDSYEKVREAYPETPYGGWIDWDETHTISYATLFYLFEGAVPGECGISYYFKDDRLEQVSFNWLDLFAGERNLYKSETSNEPTTVPQSNS